VTTDPPDRPPLELAAAEGPWGVPHLTPDRDVGAVAADPAARDHVLGKLLKRPVVPGAAPT
jgi:hypothetical protein